MLPDEIVASLLRPGDVIGLQYSQGAKVGVFPLRVQAYEYPNNQYDFSLGSATALASAGTGWSNIQDSANRYLLQPPQPGQLNQIWYGIWPTYAWVYRAYEPNVLRGGLVVPITVGGTQGYISGAQSPRNVPSPQTETFVCYPSTPAFNGYHPYAVPAIITVRMTFYIVKYLVEYAPKATPSRIVTVGGVPPSTVPLWITGPGG